MLRLSLNYQCINYTFCKSVSLSLQALANGFFNFDTFDVDEYEHYEVCTRFNNSVIYNNFVSDAYFHGQYALSHLSGRMGKPTVCIVENKGAFVFATRIVESLFYINA